MKLNRFFASLKIFAVALLFYLAGQGAWAATTKTVTYTISSIEHTFITRPYSIEFTRSGDDPFDASATTYNTKINTGSGQGSVLLADGFKLNLSWGAFIQLSSNNNCINPYLAGQITYSVSCSNYYYVTHLTFRDSESAWRDDDIPISQSWPSSSVTSSASLCSVTITYTDTPDLSILASDGENAYEIQSKHDLRHLANYVNNGMNSCEGLTFRQTQNITCDNSYTPIGNFPAKNQVIRFKGTYDGQGHRISGVTVTRTGSDNYADGFIGLFGVLGRGGRRQKHCPRE